MLILHNTLNRLSCERDFDISVSDFDVEEQFSEAIFLHETLFI